MPPPPRRLRPRLHGTEQRLDLQLDALRQAGCERVYTDRASGAKAERPGLAEALDYVREGDTLVVVASGPVRAQLEGPRRPEWASSKSAGVGFRSLQEAIDTTSAAGKLVFHVFGALAEFERDLIRERTMAGLASARARGRSGGRPRAMDDEKVKLASRLMRDPEVVGGGRCVPSGGGLLGDACTGTWPPTAPCGSGSPLPRGSGTTARSGHDKTVPRRRRIFERGRGRGPPHGTGQRAPDVASSRTYCTQAVTETAQELIEELGRLPEQEVRAASYLEDLQRRQQGREGSAVKGGKGKWRPYSSFEVPREARLPGPPDASVTYERELYGRTADLD